MERGQNELKKENRKLKKENRELKKLRQLRTLKKLRERADSLESERDYLLSQQNCQWRGLLPEGGSNIKTHR